MSKMTVIQLLNKIANGEESDIITEFEFDKKIWNLFKLQDSEYCIDGWLLNQEIVITKHKEIIEEDKKIEKYDTGLTNGRFTKDSIKSAMEGENMSLEEIVIEIAKEQTTLKEKVFEIIDKLNKGE